MTEAEGLLTPEAVRQAALGALAAGRCGALVGWTVEEPALEAVAEIVAAEVRMHYPDLRVPFHARWRHFSAGGRERWDAGRFLDAAAAARAAFDVAIVSVLLDAGAGMDWRYVEPDGTVLARSEGLAVASLAMFEAGAFADDGRSFRADAAALGRASLTAGFQVSDANPLVGLAGREALLRRLGLAVAANQSVFALADTPRPGGLFDWLVAQARDSEVPARAILIALLRHLGAIWPGREELDGVNLGDTWRHPSLGLVPFHKLSQWLAYSLIEPIQAAGLRVTGIDALTGLPEYRNGGLFVDLGVLRLRDSTDAELAHEVGSPLIVEWRAMTVALLDLLAPMVRARLGVTVEAFPLTCLLEGGTWRAGRRIAAERRADGGPPLRVISDGTVF